MAHRQRDGRGRRTRTPHAGARDRRAAARATTGAASGSCSTRPAAWDDAGEAGLRAFVEWVQHQADERARVIESVAPEPDDDALRILTVHGSKGLEFPIVVLAGLSTRPPNRRSRVLWGTGGPEFTVGSKNRGTSVATAGYSTLEGAENRRDEAERVRLLYVAMTRARDHLVLSLHRKGTQACHARSIAAHLDGAPCTAARGPPRGAGCHHTPGRE